MNPLMFSILLFLVADIVAYGVTLIITRSVMGMPMRKAMLFSSLVGTAVGLLAYLPYLFTHVLNAPK